MENKYYNQIKELIENYEVNSKVRYIEDNHEKLLTNWSIGKLLMEAQSGEKRAKYGDGLIKKWAKKLTELYGKTYHREFLRRCRKFYILFPKGSALSSISWSHIVEILTIDNINA